MLHTFTRLLFLSATVFAYSVAYAKDSADLPAGLVLTSCDLPGDFPSAAHQIDPGADSAKVVALVKVSADGSLEAITIEESNRNHRVNSWVRRELRRCKFTPATRSGAPVAGTFRLVLRAADELLLGEGRLRCEFPPASSFPAGAVPATSTHVTIKLGPDRNPAEAVVRESLQNPVPIRVAHEAMT
jgi:hypothetical protein